MRTGMNKVLANFKQQHDQNIFIVFASSKNHIDNNRFRTIFKMYL